MSISVEILNSTFGFIGQNAFNFHGSIYVNIYNNIFLHLANNSFNFGTSLEDTGDIYYTTSSSELFFHFISNKIYNLTASSLKFLTNFIQIKEAPKGAKVDIKIDHIELPKQSCGCQITEMFLSDWLGTKNPRYLNHFEEVSYCLVNDVLSSCYNVKQGGIIIKKFLNLICVNNTNIIQCPKEESVSKKIVIETITNDEELLKHKLFSEENREIRSEKHYLYLIIALSLIFLVVLLSGLLLLLIKGGLWLKKKGK